MPQVLVTKPIMHGGVTYKAGSKIEVSEAQVERLVSIGAVSVQASQANAKAGKAAAPLSVPDVARDKVNDKSATAETIAPVTAPEVPPLGGVKDSK